MYFSIGFEGARCQINVDDCDGHLCQNGGRCVDGVNTYSCECPPEYTGQYCTQDVDECAMRPDICQNGATCANTDGGYSCICVNGFEGKNCEIGKAQTQFFIKSYSCSYFSTFFSNIRRGRLRPTTLFKWGYL